jgi:hypothetical protein
MKGIDKYHETSIKEIDHEMIKSYKMYDKYLKSTKKEAKILEI